MSLLAAYFLSKRNQNLFIGIFIKREDILPYDLVKSRSREIRV